MNIVVKPTNVLGTNVGNLWDVFEDNIFKGRCQYEGNILKWTGKIKPFIKLNIIEPLIEQLYKD